MTKAKAFQRPKQRQRIKNKMAFLTESEGEKNSTFITSL